MKQLTTKQVMNALIENLSIELDHNGDIEYFLHIKDNGEIVRGMSYADVSFQTHLDKEAYEKRIEEDSEYDISYNIEKEDNPYFMEVVEELTKQANEYLKDWGE
jgi:hypothetical protein